MILICGLSFLLVGMKSGKDYVYFIPFVMVTMAAAYWKKETTREISHIYSIMRAKNKTKKEKLLLIEKVMKDGQAKKYYYQQKIVGLKEKIVILGEKYYGKRSKSGAMSRKSTS